MECFYILYFKQFKKSSNCECHDKTFCRQIFLGLSKRIIHSLVLRSINSEFNNVDEMDGRLKIDFICLFWQHAINLRTATRVNKNYTRSRKKGT